MITNHKQIIERWPTMAEFAAESGIKYSTATAMKTRGNIPSRYWVRIVAAAQKRGFEDIDMDLLAETSRLNDGIGLPDNITTAAE